MKFKISIILLLNSIILHAQDVHIHGVVIDNQTRLPIAGVTISASKYGRHFKTDDAGKFELSIKSVTHNDTLKFSCIGYQPQNIVIGEIQRDSIIKMSPLINELKEVKVGTKPAVLINVGSKRRKGYEGRLTKPGDNYAMYMEGSKNVKGTIHSIGFFLTKGHGMFKGGDVMAPFRIRLLSVNTNGMPGEDLIADSIIVSAKNEWAWFDADIFSYHIKNPDNGFFVCFSLLNYKNYRPISQSDTIMHASSAEDSSYGRPLLPKVNGQVEFGTPRVCFTSDEFKQTRSYLYGYTLEDNSLHWIELDSNKSYAFRATIEPE